MQEILDAINAGATGDDIANVPLPEAFRGAHVLRSEADMWEGVESWDKDPRKSLHVGEIPMPELAPDEVVIANMAPAMHRTSTWSGPTPPAWCCAAGRPSATGPPATA
jgi:crotonyl-CoA reductase